MTIPLTIIGLAVLAALVQAIGSVLRKKPSSASWFFCLGMLVFAAEGGGCARMCRWPRIR